MLYKFTKRVFDILFSLTVLTLLFFPMLLISLLIKVSSKGPILYDWKGVGKNGVFFNSFKFRTMVSNADELKEELKAVITDQAEYNTAAYQSRARQILKKMDIINIKI